MSKKNKKIKSVNLNEIFICDGNLYAIAVPKTASNSSNLSDGRSIFEFVKIN